MSIFNFKNIDGREIYLNIIEHDSRSFSYEFIISVEQKSWTKKLLNTFLLIISLIFFFYFYNYFLKCFFCVCILYCLSILDIFYVQNESILMIAPLGFQLTTGYNLGYQSTQFIPWNFVKDIIINEGFSFQRVIYYLAFMINNEDIEDQLIPLFKKTRPQLETLELIYQKIKKTFDSCPKLNSINTTYKI